MRTIYQLKKNSAQPLEIGQLSPIIALQQKARIDARNERHLALVADGSGA
jgi:hypothetical protein